MAVEIPFQKTLEFEYGQVDELSPQVRRVIANNPSPFTFYGTGTYIVGHGTVAVIDPGPADPEHINAILSATKGETISHLFVTHTHTLTIPPVVRCCSNTLMQLAVRSGHTDWAVLVMSASLVPTGNLHRTEYSKIRR